MKGRKTYVACALIAALGFAKGVGWIDDAQFQIGLTILNALGLAALRAGVKKGEK